MVNFNTEKSLKLRNFYTLSQLIRSDPLCLKARGWLWGCDAITRTDQTNR
jgi:hypothetical protein